MLTLLFTWLLTWTFNGLLMTGAANTIEFRPHSGPQEKFFASSADIVIYGGARGGGKSYALLLDALRHVENPGYRHAIYRRTSEEITKPGAMWDESTKIYPYLGGVPRVSSMDWKFPSGAIISFAHCEHVNDLEKHKGRQFAGLGFDELTGFEEIQFWLLMGSNRSVCGVRPFVRATCNPVPNSWVADLISWWIDSDLGLPITERAGVIRWFARVGDELQWGDSAEELHEQFGPAPDIIPRSLTFIPAKLADNPSLMKTPEYLAALQSLPAVERAKHLDGNWKMHSGGLINREHLRWYEQRGDIYMLGSNQYELSRCRRFATIDTAGSGKDRAKEERGKKPSNTACGIWDSCRAGDSSLLFLREVYCKRQEYGDLKRGILETLTRHNCKVVRIEDATIGTALASDLKEAGCRVEMIPTKLPGQKDAAEETSKYERAVASGLLTAIENGWVCLPKSNPNWVKPYLAELTGWRGLPNDPADQIDMSSFAAFHTKHQVAKWDGPVTVAAGGRLNSMNSSTIGARR